MIRSSVRRTTVLAVSAALALTATIAASAPATSAAQQSGVTATASALDVIAGSPVTITGTATPSSKVVLQERIAGKWVPLRPTVTTTTAPDGTYSLAYPANWYLSHRLRVKDTGTKDASGIVAVNVHPSYAPTGSASSWKPLLEGNARWNPCETITWQVNPTDGYANGAVLLAEAFAEMSRASGLRYKYLGTTTLEAGQKRGKNAADILVDWKTPQQDRRLSDGTLGYATMLYGRAKTRQMEITRSDIVLDLTESLNPEDFNEEPEFIAEVNDHDWTDTIQHEIAHTIGLDHVDDETQLMTPSASFVEGGSMIGAGDLAGLRAMGASKGCITGSRR